MFLVKRHEKLIVIDQLSYRKRGPHIISLVPAANLVGKASYIRPSKDLDIYQLGERERESTVRTNYNIQYVTYICKIINIYIYM